ncbi:hypothetical protein KTJ32_17730 [Acinetobacter gyllenbergii]|uniref:hypothetical protein n=1 Tax=Acinetobacter TaxID=469 RepID=UPI0014905116|nr:MULTISPECIES: hypothetical protein [Acinetobacter]MCU4582839.1 hypothetical protein [Acinetobacter gyllenbergii]NNP69569.1 hypothetical protein [Acinetobacter sp. Ac_5812]
MLKKLTLAILITIPAMTHANNTSLIQNAKQSIRESIKDPRSAQFQHIRVVKNLRGETAVCGEVNAKNAFGGYVGFTPFMYVDGGSYLASGDKDYQEDFYYVYILSGCMGVSDEKEFRDQLYYEQIQQEEQIRQEQEAQIRKEQEEQARKEREEEAERIKQITAQNLKEIEEKNKLDRLTILKKDREFYQRKKLTATDIERREYNKQVKTFCNFLYDYYTNRIQHGFSHEDAFLTVAAAYNNMGLNSVYDSLDAVEITLQDGFERIQNNKEDYNKFVKDGAFFRGWMKGTCIVQRKI